MEIDYARNRKYFGRSAPQGGIIMVVMGLALALVLPEVGKLVGILVIVAGVMLLYVVFARMPPDADIDRGAAEAAASMKHRALAAHGLEEHQVKLVEPVVVHGYCYRNSASGMRVKPGKDQVFRSSTYEGVVLFFGEHRLYAYMFQFSLISEQASRERADEYAYKDVVSMTTRPATFTAHDIKGNTRQVDFEEFRLITSDGTSITSSIHDQGSITRAIACARTLVRERRPP